MRFLIKTGAERIRASGLSRSAQTKKSIWLPICNQIDLNRGFNFEKKERANDGT